MSLRLLTTPQKILRFPRLRGDEPGLTFMTVVAVVFSPLTRG